MRIEDVKVKAIDYSARYLYPNRSVEIKTSSGTILTPTRSATSYEYRQKAQVPTDISFNNPISISIENLNHSRFEKLLQTNQYYGKLMKKIELSDRLAQYSDLRLVLLRPTVTPKRDPQTKQITRISPMEILKQNSSLRERFIRFIIKMQYDMGLNPITIPFLEMPFQDLQDTLKMIDKSLERLNRQSLFFIDLSYKNFEGIIDLIANEMQSKMIGLYFRPFRRFPLNYEVLFKYVDRDIAFFSALVSRYDNSYYDISTMHYLPFFGNDVYAVRKSSPFGGRTQKKPFDRIRSVRLFDKENLCIKPINFTSQTVDGLVDEYSNDAIVRSMLANYQEASTDDAKYKVLRAFSKASELKSSSNEFERFQNFISDSSTRDYMQEKQFLHRTLQEVTKRQTTLR